LNIKITLVNLNAIGLHTIHSLLVQDKVDHWVHNTRFRTLIQLVYI